MQGREGASVAHRESGTLEASMGIPCNHSLLGVRGSSRLALFLGHSHLQHYLRVRNPRNPSLTVGDPVTARGRGRPAGMPNPIRAERSTRSEPSRFELQLGEWVSGFRRGRPRRRLHHRAGRECLKSSDSFCTLLVSGNDGTGYLESAE